jgi:hypothetical protein
MWMPPSRGLPKASRSAGGYYYSGDSGIVFKMENLGRLKKVKITTGILNNSTHIKSQQ